MRPSIKFIKNFANVNQFNYADEWQVRQGDVATLYFQLVDLDQDSLRIIPTAGGSLSVSVTFPSPNTPLVKVASQNSQDGSIWSVPLLATDLVYTGVVQIKYTQSNGNVYNFNIDQGLQVELLSIGDC